MDGTEGADVGLIAARHVLDVVGVGLWPGVKLLPHLANVAPGDFDERHEALLIEIVHLAVERLEVGGVDPFEIWNEVLEAGHLAGKEKWAFAGFGVHVLAALGAGLSPGVTQHGAIGHSQTVGMRIVRPVRQCGENPNAVVALLAPVAHIILKTGVGSHGALFLIIAPWKAKRRCRPPSVANHEIRCAVRILERVTIGRRANHSAPARIRRFIVLAPGHCFKFTTLPDQPRIVRLRTAAPHPLACCRGHHAHAERIAAIPKSVAPFFETRPLQVHPHLRVGIGIRECLL